MIEAQPEAVALPTHTLLIDGARVVVEVACTEASRRQGLMHRQALAPDTGMLFVFRQSLRFCFWMKDTLIPLNAAFIDADGVVIGTAEMMPGDLTRHWPARPARYGLEMPAGWFAAHGIVPGMRIEGLPPSALSVD